MIRKKLEIVADRSGYLELIEFNDLLRTLKTIDSKFILKEEVESFIAKGQTIAILYYNGEENEEELIDKLLKDISIVEERAAYNDYRFSLQKTVDITLRFLSPGINDPNTAIHCINILGVLLSKIGAIEGKYTAFFKKIMNQKLFIKTFILRMTYIILFIKSFTMEKRTYLSL